MDILFQWLELYTSIATIAILYIEWSRKNKGLIEKTTRIGKIIMGVLALISCCYIIFKSITLGTEGTSVLKYFVQACQIFLFFLSIFYFLDRLGLTKNIIAQRIEVKN